MDDRQKRDVVAIQPKVFHHDFLHGQLPIEWDLFMQVVQLFLPIISTSPIANLLASRFVSIFGQGLVSLQNIVAGMA